MLGKQVSGHRVDLDRLFELGLDSLYEFAVPYNLASLFNLDTVLFTS